MRRSAWRLSLAVSSALVAVLICILVASPAAAAPGDLDEGFGEQGIVLSPQVGASATNVVETDLGIVAVGYAGDPGFSFGPLDMAVARYDAQGVLDETFDADGFTFINAWDLAAANAVAAQPDGKLVVVGVGIVTGNAGLAIARLDDEGALDETFSGDGVTRLDFGSGSDAATAVALAPSGRIVVAGRAESTSGGTNFVVAVYLSNGELDPSFSDDGIRTIDFHASDAATDVSVLGNEKIVVGGSTQVTGRGLGVVRLLPDGTLDASFGVGGKVAIGAPSGIGRAMSLGPDGKVVLAGTAPPGAHDAGGYDMVVVRLLRNGNVDRSFSGNGRLRTDIGGGEDAAEDVLVTPGGKIIACGYAEKPTSSRRTFAIVRYRDDGRLDRSFGGDGIVRTAVGADSFALACARQADGRVVGAGSGPGFALVRYATQ